MRQNISAIVRETMLEFAGLTGLSPAGKTPRRYLWTDAFAVCNFLELYRQTGDDAYRDLSLRLVEQVHTTLGRHRADDPRTGCISGLDEQEAGKHPTIGGLRIGKELNERKPSDPFDETLEWDRDGQYYHYLTKWMHALDRVSRVTGSPVYNTWALELAKTAHAKFTYLPLHGKQKRMYWKMSIDLSRPLVQSMGHHDPLDGFITYSQLQATAAARGEKSGVDLSAEIADMAGMCEGKEWTTDDPLGLGELLCSAWKVAQLAGNADFAKPDLMDILLESSLAGLRSYSGANDSGLPAEYRLAFRELGLSIGLRAAEKLRLFIEENPGLFKKKDPLHLLIKALMQYAPLAETIETFWLERANRESNSWTAHRDINMVMLATSLAPDAYLTL